MKTYQVHERFFGNLKMNGKMLLYPLILSIIIQVFLLLYIANKGIYISDTNISLPISVSFKYHTGFTGIFTNEAAVEKEMLPYSKGWTSLPINLYRQFADYLTNDAYIKQGKYAKYSFGIYPIIFVLYILAFAGKAKESGDKYVRGSKMTPIDEFNKKLANEAKKDSLSGLKIGDTVLPFGMESKHTLILGTSGSGKGVLLNQMVAQINERKQKHNTNDRCIFYDVKGEFVAKQFQKGDHIFYPFDKRSLAWNIFNELEIQPDFDVISRSLFVSPDAKNAYWYNCASDVFRTGLVWLKSKNQTKNSDLWNFFSQPVSEIQVAFEELPLSEQGALKHIDNSDSTTSASIISILQERIQFFRYLVDVDGDFSFREYVRGHQSNKPQPNLFILNIEQYSMLFKPLMTLVIDIMCREALSLPDDSKRRLFFILDELGTLGRMDSVIQLETVGRSKGACLVCANQDLGRIEEQYGEANLKSFFNNFNTTLTFRIREPKTSEFLSSAIGEQQLIKTTESSQMNPGGVGDRKSISEQEKVEKLILPSEFQTLPDLNAIINIAGFGISKVALPRIFYEEKYQNFIMRDFAPLISLADNAQTALLSNLGNEIESETFELIGLPGDTEMAEQYEAGNQQEFDSLDFSTILEEENPDEENHDRENPDDEYIDKEGEK